MYIQPGLAPGLHRYVCLCVRVRGRMRVCVSVSGFVRFTAQIQVRGKQPVVVSTTLGVDMTSGDHFSFSEI